MKNIFDVLKETAQAAFFVSVVLFPGRNKFSLVYLL